MLINLIGLVGTYMFLFGSVYLTLHYCIFKRVWVDRVIYKKFYLNEIVCVITSLIIVIIFFRYLFRNSFFSWNRKCV